DREQTRKRAVRRQGAARSDRGAARAPGRGAAGPAKVDGSPRSPAVGLGDRRFTAPSPWANNGRRMRAWKRLSLLACAFAMATHSGGAAAASLSASGLTFSDELGGFNIVSASGSGTLADPFVVVEEITGPQEPVLVIRGLSPVF